MTALPSTAHEAPGFPLADLLGVLREQEPELTGDGNVRLCGVRQDSRRVEAGDLFVARNGGKVSGAQFAEAAVERGAVAVLAERGVLRGGVAGASARSEGRSP